MIGSESDGLLAYALLPEKVLVHIDYFTYQHFALYIFMESVVGPFRCQEGTAVIIKIWLQIYIIFLLADKLIDILHLLQPVGIRWRLEGKHDVFRIYGWQGHDNRPDVILLASAYNLP